MNPWATLTSQAPWWVVARLGIATAWGQVWHERTPYVSLEECVWLCGGEVQHWTGHACGCQGPPAQP